jgi:putative membrane protein
MTSRDVGIVLMVVLGAVVFLPVLMMSMWGGWGMMGPGMMSGWRYGQGFGFGPLVLLLFIGGVGLIVLAFTRKEPRGEEPLELLKRRLAKGEITKEQFDELKEAVQ